MTASSSSRSGSQRWLGASRSGCHSGEAGAGQEVQSQTKISGGWPVVVSLERVYYHLYYDHRALGTRLWVEMHSDLFLPLVPIAHIQRTVGIFPIGWTMCGCFKQTWSSQAMIGPGVQQALAGSGMTSPEVCKKLLLQEEPSRSLPTPQGSTSCTPQYKPCSAFCRVYVVIRAHTHPDCMVFGLQSLSAVCIAMF